MTLVKYNALMVEYTTFYLSTKLRINIIMKRNNTNYSMRSFLFFIRLYEVCGPQQILIFWSGVLFVDTYILRKISNT